MVSDTDAQPSKFVTKRRLDHGESCKINVLRSHLQSLEVQKITGGGGWGGVVPKPKPKTKVVKGYILEGSNSWVKRSHSWMEIASIASSPKLQSQF